MSDKQDKALVQAAVDDCFADVQADPYLARKILNRARQKRPVRRFSFVLAAALVLALGAFAYAASRFGWADYYRTQAGIDIPQGAEEALNASQPRTYQVGPMTFTFQQLLTDGRIVLSSASAQLTDGGAALYAPDSNFEEAVDCLSDTVLERYDLPSGTLWTEAASQLNLPLYGVRALVEIDPAYSKAVSMEDSLWNEDGSIVYFSMPLLKVGAAPDPLPATLYMSVIQFDPESGTMVERWQHREEITLETVSLLETKTYLPKGQTTLGNVTLQSLQAERYVTGTYLNAVFTVPQAMDQEDLITQLYQIRFCNESGATLPDGLSQGSDVLMDDWPTVTLETSTTMEELPQQLMLIYGEEQLQLKAG